ncbi:glucose-1-phosphate adenylyltransferase [bacterium]|nr:glucose-1-phosphate adenylyltransferase [bacterium]
MYDKYHVARNSVLTLLLAGGSGTRLFPLTQIRSKPSVPFAGRYRIIDFTLSNCINSNLRRIYVFTQYKSQSLTEHLMDGWNFLSTELEEFISVVPPQLRLSNKWYQGTADAIFQNLNLLDVRRPEYVLIVSADHIYRMDYMRMLYYHIEKGADLTIAALEVPKEEATGFGVMGTDASGAIREFQEKPQNPKTIPGKPDTSFASMGIYIFKTEALIKAVVKDAKLNTDHDFGKNVIPSMLEDGYNLFAYSYVSDPVGKGYWRDVGTLDSYFQASMDALDDVFPLENPYWPIHTYNSLGVPTKIASNKNPDGSTNIISDTLISHSCNIKAKKLYRSILSSGVKIEEGAEVENSILFENVVVGKEARIRNVIIDKNVVIEPGVQIGYNLTEDRKRFVVSEDGLIVIPKNQIIGHI